MNKLLILAYNEELYINETIEKYINKFHEIIVVDDFSKDNTVGIVKDLKGRYENLTIVQNSKNLGAGKSMEIGIQKALETKFEFLVKVDGDNQFAETDIDELVHLAKNNSAAYVKSDRFWKDGIDGKIPKIRYFGNAFASFLIKFITGNSNVNDPLNGLFLFSYELSKTIKIPKMFNRYGYPFFVNTQIFKQCIESDIKLFQYRNKVRYKNETSYIRPFVLFIKLILYSIKFYVEYIKEKFKYSNYQMSALLDVFSITSLAFSLFSISRSISVRYFGVDGNQSAWFILFILFFLFFILLNIGSRNIIKNLNSKIFEYL